MQTRVAKPDGGLPSSEALLLDYAERLAKYLPGRRAVHVHLSKLLAVNRREHHLRMAASAFDPLVRRAQGQNFRLSNGDIVVVVKDVPVAEIDDVVLRLRYMFGDDPLVHVPDDPGTGPEPQMEPETEPGPQSSGDGWRRLRGLFNK